MLGEYIRDNFESWLCSYFQFFVVVMYILIAMKYDTIYDSSFILLVSSAVYCAIGHYKKKQEFRELERKIKYLEIKCEEIPR